MAFFTEKGYILHKSDVETGTSKTGTPWSKMTIVISCDGKTTPYDKVAFSVFGEKCIDADKFKLGDRVAIEFSVSSREWNGKWFSDISLFSIKNDLETAPVMKAKEEIKPDTFDATKSSKHIEDMPF